MKKLFVVTAVLLAVLTAFLIGGRKSAVADQADRVCVQHKQGKTFVIKWVEPSSLEGHMKHGDKPCFYLTETAEAQPTNTAQPTVTLTPTNTPPYIYKLFMPFFAGGPRCWWCWFSK